VKKTALLTAALTALAFTAGSLAPAYAAVPDVDLRPGQLTRGADAAVPHVEGKAVVDGSFTARFPKAGGLRLLGTSGGDYVVATWSNTGATVPKVVRVTPADERSTILSDVPVWELTMTDDGGTIIWPRIRYRAKETLARVYSATDGSEVARRTFAGLAWTLDGAGDVFVLTASQPGERTFTWNTATDRVKRVSDRAGYAASIAADRLAVMTKDPYRGGCSLVTRLSDPGTKVWRSCDQAVYTFSPDTSRMLTVYILTDGLGPGRLQLRRGGGRLVATYHTYYFGEALWETGAVPLMLTHGKKQTAWVRCAVDACERASELTRTQL
jgi:hypothetical protein